MLDFHCLGPSSFRVFAPAEGMYRRRVMTERRPHARVHASRAETCSLDARVRTSLVANASVYVRTSYGPTDQTRWRSREAGASDLPTAESTP
jgi:hypothetical protein